MPTRDAARDIFDQDRNGLFNRLLRAAAGIFRQNDLRGPVEAGKVLLAAFFVQLEKRLVNLSIENFEQAALQRVRNRARQMIDIGDL